MIQEIVISCIIKTLREDATRAEMKDTVKGQSAAGEEACKAGFYMSTQERIEQDADEKS